MEGEYLPYLHVSSRSSHFENTSLVINLLRAPEGPIRPCGGYFIYTPTEALYVLLITLLRRRSRRSRPYQKNDAILLLIKNGV